MENQQEWDILSDQIADELWEIVYQQFSFDPDYDAKDSRYTLTEPYDLYSCEEVVAIADSDPNWRKTIQNIFCTCLKDQEYMYVLDWQHTCYKYFPQVKTRKAKSTFIEDKNIPMADTMRTFQNFTPMEIIFCSFLRICPGGI